MKMTHAKGSKLGWFICSLGALFYAYEYLLRISPGVMGPDLMRSFNASAAMLGNLSAIYYYAYNPMQIPVGVMMDKYGPRAILTFAVFCCVVGTLMFGMTTSVWVAGVGRFFIGFGSAFAFVGVLKLASLWLPPNRFALVSGLTTTLGFIGGGAVGYMVLARWVDKIGWSDTMLYLGGLGCLLIPVMWFLIKDHHEPRIAAEKEIHSYKKLWQEVYAVLTNRQVLLNGLVGGFLMLPTSVFAELWGVQYLQVVHHLDHTTAASAVSMIFVGWAVGAPISGFFSDHYKRRVLPMRMGSLIAALLLFAILYLPFDQKFVLFALLFLFGVASSTEIICFAVGCENSKPHMAGTAAATTNFLITLGPVFFQPLVGCFLDLTWTGQFFEGIRVYTPQGYKTAYFILPATMFIATFLSFWLKETYCRSQHD